MKFKQISKTITVGAGTDLMQNDTIKTAIKETLGYTEEMYQSTIANDADSLSGFTMKYTIMASDTNSIIVNGSTVVNNAFVGVFDSGGYVQIRSLELVSADTVSVLITIG